MRVADAVLYNQVINDLAAADRRRIEVHSQLSSGRRLQRPSDNPIDVMTALRYRTELAEIGQFLSNAGEARDWLDATESALGSATALVQRAREIAVTGANSPLPAGSYAAMADEVHQLRAELIQLGNTTLDGRYIFGGYKTLSAPFDTAGNYLGDAGVISREIGPGITLDVNLPGAVGSHPAFTPALNALQQLENDLRALASSPSTGTTTAVSNDIAALDGVLDNLLAVRAQVGAKTNRVQLAEARLQDLQVSVTRLQSGVEEVDIAETAVRLSVQENAYRVALSAAARLVQTTLLDFLR